MRNHEMALKLTFCPVGGIPHQIPGVRAGGDLANRDLVPLCDHVLGGHVEAARRPGAVHVRERSHSLLAGRKPRFMTSSKTRPAACLSSSIEIRLLSPNRTPQGPRERIRARCAQSLRLPVIKILQIEVILK